MREIFKTSKIKYLFFTIILFIFTACEGFNFEFNGDLRAHIEEDVGVTYSFYEYPDLNSQHIDKILITGKTISNSDFPSYVHDDTLLVGWQYLCNSETGSKQMPNYFTFNEKNYINSIRPGITDESLYAIWKKKCTITFVTNWPGVELDPVIMPEGDLLQWPNVERQGNWVLWNWCTDKELTQWYNFSEPVTGDMTLYGRWVEVRTITYHKNDGSGEETHWDYQINTENVFADYMFRPRDGYGFMGWSDTPSGGVKKYPGDSFTITQDMDFYAVWSSDLVTVTYIDKYGAFPNKKVRVARNSRYSVGHAYSDDDSRYTDLGEIWVASGKTIYGYDESANVPMVNGAPNVKYSRWGWYETPDNQGQWRGSNYITITSNKTFYVYWDDMIVEGGDVLVGITFEESPDSDIPGLVSGPTVSGSTYTFTATTGYDEYRWYFDGVYQSSTSTNVLEIGTGALFPGIYNITVVVRQGTDYYSWQGTLTKS